MKLKLLISISGLFLVNWVFAQSNKIPVFVAGGEGYKSYRIPALFVLPGGRLLAFCEGRVNGENDFGNIDIVMKASDDNGKNWSPLKIVVDADSLQAGNPAPVLDMTDPLYPSGRLFLFYNTGNNHEGETRKGKGLREAWYITSIDKGETWSKPINTTLQVHRPKQPNVNPAYNFAEDWRSYANTPGHALQFDKGRYKGRLYVAANHSAGDPQPHFTDYRAHSYYTDDHGKTFHLSEDVPVPGGNENMAVALDDGRLMINCRNQQGNIKTRIVATSSDGGVSWDSAWYDHNLPDPVCQGSILRIGNYKGQTMLAFCNDADTISRNNLTLRISADAGKTWKRNYPVDGAPAYYKGSFTAYSDIADLSKNRIGILYERNNYKEIVFTIINWKR